MKAIAREPINAITHLGGAVAFLIATIALNVIATMEHILYPAVVASIWIFGLSLVALYTASGVYHMLNVTPETLLKLRKLDHSMIFVLIAGSYTPFCIMGRRWGLLALIWTLAILGIGMKILWMGMPRTLSTAMYMAMGWLAITQVQTLYVALPRQVFLLLLYGGIMYTIGGIIYGTKKPNISPRFGFHEIFHVFCLLGSLCHFIAVAIYLVR